MKISKQTTSVNHFCHSGGGAFFSLVDAVFVALLVLLLITGFAVVVVAWRSWEMCSAECTWFTSFIVPCGVPAATVMEGCPALSADADAAKTTILLCVITMRVAAKNGIEESYFFFPCTFFSSTTMTVAQSGKHKMGEGLECVLCPVFVHKHKCPTQKYSSDSWLMLSRWNSFGWITTAYPHGAGSIKCTNTASWPIRGGKKLIESFWQMMGRRLHSYLKSPGKLQPGQLFVGAKTLMLQMHAWCSLRGCSLLLLLFQVPSCIMHVIDVSDSD